MTNNQDGATNRQTIEAKIRKDLNSCDLKGFNSDFFLTSTFVSNLADIVQDHERAAYQRGVHKQQQLL